MDYHKGDRVRLRADFIEKLKQAGYYRAKQDEGIGIIREMLNARIAQIEIPGAWPGRLLHIDHIEHA